MGWWGRKGIARANALSRTEEGACHTHQRRHRTPSRVCSCRCRVLGPAGSSHRHYLICIRNQSPGRHASIARPAINRPFATLLAGRRIRNDRYDPSEDNVVAGSEVRKHPDPPALWRGPSRPCGVCSSRGGSHAAAEWRADNARAAGASGVAGKRSMRPCATQCAASGAPPTRYAPATPATLHKPAQVAQAVAAIQSAYEAGISRQRVELLLPLIGATDLDDCESQC
jgi:hypothetical protein